MDSVDTLDKIDIEDELDNKDGHFRSCHGRCISPGMITPGTIIEANCGVLYRSEGRLMRIIESHCEECINNIGKKECLICGKGNVFSR